MNALTLAGTHQYSMGPAVSCAFARRDDLIRQAAVANELGSAFVTQVLLSAYRQLDHAPRLAQMIDSWPGDPAASAMALRLNAGLHALARRGSPEILAALYRHEHKQFDMAVRMAFQDHEDSLMSWMTHPTQTNEIARSAGFMAALMTLSVKVGMPFELLEIGASAGLNLRLDRYAYSFGGVVAGDAGSPVRISPQWRGAGVDAAPVEIASARGVDLRPLPLGDLQTRERLLSYVWADDPSRRERLEAAIDLARGSVPVVERGDAASWLHERLRSPQSAGVCRVVLHSMVLQYLTSGDRQSALASIREAGRRATADRPLARIGLEWDEGRREVQLMLTCWAGPEAGRGDARQIATCHVYGNWIDWRG